MTYQKLFECISDLGITVQPDWKGKVSEHRIVFMLVKGDKCLPLTPIYKSIQEAKVPDSIVENIEHVFGIKIPKS